MKTAMLFVVGGSSDIGKSTFLAYMIVRLRKRFRNIAVCYASKAAKALNGTPRMEDVTCVVWQMAGDFENSRGTLSKRSIISRKGTA